MTVQKRRRPGKPGRGRRAATPVGLVPVWEDPGPFDIIGDIHGCADELEELLEKLGYRSQERSYDPWYHPGGRRLVFLGDLCDRGPKNVAVLELVTTMFFRGRALYTPGNHCDKLYRYLNGRKVQMGHGLADTVGELESMQPPARRRLVAAFKGMFQMSPPYLILDGGKLVVVHAGILEEMIGYISPRIRRFCLYGDPTGRRDEYGRPIRREWAKRYRGQALIVFGHEPVPEPRFVNNTVNIDQGCVFGGRLTAYRYPEGEVVHVPARRAYDESRLDQFLPAASSAR